MRFIGSILILFTHMILATAVTSFSMPIASNQRSEAAVNRVKPLLENELIQLGVKWGTPVFIRIFKDESVLEVWVRQMDRFVRFKSYQVCNYGPKGLGHKTREGDKRAPEGFYFVTASALNPNSKFHLSFDLGYPNSYDMAHGLTGTAIMVHGRCKSVGCYSVSDMDIEEIYSLVEAGLRHGQSGVPVHVFPFRMTPENMQKYKGHLWESFWKNLKDGYDMFMRDGFRPPRVTVQNKRYVFKKKSEGGYDFNPGSVKGNGLHIMAEAWFVPDEKKYFRPYFTKGFFEVVDPYKESFILIIEPVNQAFIRHHFAVLDPDGRVLEVRSQETYEWQSLEFAPIGLKRLISRICAYYYR